MFIFAKLDCWVWLDGASGRGRQERECVCFAAPASPGKLAFSKGMLGFRNTIDNEVAHFLNAVTRYSRKTDLVPGVQLWCLGLRFEVVV